MFVDDLVLRPTKSWLSRTRLSPEDLTQTHPQGNESSEKRKVVRDSKTARSRAIITQGAAGTCGEKRLDSLIPSEQGTGIVGGVGQFDHDGKGSEEKGCQRGIDVGTVSFPSRLRDSCPS